jgi:hypothetical protein
VSVEILAKGWAPVDPHNLQAEFEDLLISLGIVWEQNDGAPASPEYTEGMKEGNWHTDSNGAHVPWGVVVWADHTPTPVEGIDAERSPLRENPGLGIGNGDVLLIHNRETRHKTPASTGPRVVCRAWVAEESDYRRQGE